MTARYRKRQEAREVARELSARDPLPVPFTDLSDCRHHCNGSHVLNGHPDPLCDWQCHPGLRLDPARAARYDEFAAWYGTEEAQPWLADLPEDGELPMAAADL
jgi:hypothetical protein